MPALGRPTPRRALVAAASQIERSATSQPYKPEQESDELWGLYRALGELRFIVNFKANAASRLAYFPGLVSEPGEDPDPDQAADPAREAFEAVQGPLGEFPDFIAELAMHTEVVGEGFFIGQQSDGDFDFDVWSSDEYRAASQAGKTKRHQDDVEPLTDDDIAVRVWRPDPQYRYRADSPFRAVRHEAETLILLRNMAQALTRSRLPAKILGIPDELSFATPNPQEEDPESDPFMNELIKAIVTSVTDDKSAARFAPLLIRGPGDRLGQIKEIDLTRDMPEWIETLTEQTIRRLAAGMDIPAEVLTGVADVNHWTAWQIEESAYKQHVDPLVTMILDSLTRGYLWPYLREAGLAEDQVRRNVLWRDYSDLTARTASVESAFGVYDRGGLSLDALRQYTGFNEADAPDDDDSGDVEDLRTRIEAAGALIRAGWTPDGAAAAVGLPDIPHTGFLPVTLGERRIESETDVEIEDVPERTVEEIEVEEMPAGPDNTVPGTPLVAAGVPALSLGEIDRRLFVAITEASQAALDRALERAGNKIRSQVQGGGGSTGRPAKHPTFAAKIDGQTGRDIGLSLGRDVIHQTLQLSDDDLIPPGTFEPVADRVEGLLAGGQSQTHQAAQDLLGRELPRDEQQEEGWRKRARDFLVATLTTLGLAKLFTPDARPNPAETGEVSDSHIPAGDVFDTLTLASGGEPTMDPTQPRGLANGQQTHEWIQETGAVTEGYMWQHGAPAVPFEPHRALNGTRFDRWTSEVLNTPASASWLGTPQMFPGDHRGCTCLAVPIVETGEEEG